MRKISVIASFLIFPILSFCQSRGIVWQKPIGGSSSESADLLIHSRDSTFLMATSSSSINGEVGGNYSNGNSPDIWLVNYNKSGAILWSRRIGSSTFEYVYDGFQKNNGEYMIGGQAGSGNDFDVNGNHGYTDMWVINLAENGNTRWAKCFGGSSFDDLKKIIPTDDGGYIILGSTLSIDFDAFGNHGWYDVLVMKIDSLGNTLWRNVLGGDQYEKAVDVTKSADGSIYILAKTNSNNTGNVTNYKGEDDIWVIKLNNSGVLQWQKTLGGSSSEYPVGIRITNDNNLLILSSTLSNDGDVTGNHGSSDIWLVKLNTSGNIIWQKSFGGTNGDGADEMIEETDGSIVFLGASKSNNGNLTGNKGESDIWVVKLTIDGNIQWQKNYGGSRGEDPLKLQKKLNNTGYYILGYTLSPNDGDVLGYHISPPSADTLISDAWLLDLDASGNLVSQRCFGGTNRDYLYHLIQISENELMLAGQTLSFDGDINGGYNTSSHSFGDSWLILFGAVNRIKGIVFFDNNRNSVKDSGEFLVNSIRVNSVRSNYERSSFTNNGLFINEVDTGIFTTNVQLISPYFTTAPLLKTTPFASFNNTDSFSFALQATLGQRDLTISAIPLNVARPGFSLTYKLFYKNIGTDTVTNGVILFKKDPRFNFIFAAPAVSSTSGDTLKWNYSNFKPFDSASIIINMQVQPPPAVKNNDTLSSVAIITPVANDLTPSDDTSFVKQIVVGSYDPNDKSENFAGKIMLQQVANSTYINYWIRFQNTGTDTAFNITVRDTLDTKLEWNSLQMIGSSHPYQIQINSQNKLAWQFNNIRLPDSNRNEPRSHGFIAYRVKSKNNLVVGDTIKNSASIFFDYNLPVQTNRQNTIVSNNIITGINNIDNRSFAMLIFPNPADNDIWIRIKERIYGNTTIVITDISGRQIYRENLGRVSSSDFSKKINLKNIPPGTYIVGLYSDNKYYVQKLIIQ